MISYADLFILTVSSLSEGAREYFTERLVACGAALTQWERGALINLGAGDSAKVSLSRAPFSNVHQEHRWQSCLMADEIAQGEVGYVIT